VQRVGEEGEGYQEVRGCGLESVEGGEGFRDGNGQLEKEGGDI